MAPKGQAYGGKNNEKGKAPKGKGKGKDRGKNNEGRRNVGFQMPWGLEGCVANLEDGTNRRLCFGCNLGECTLAQPGQQCPKGFHLCAKPSCGKSHAACDHR